MLKAVYMQNQSILLSVQLTVYTHISYICDCLSKNRPSSHLPVFQEIATILKIQLKITSLALVVETFTEHNNT